METLTVVSVIISILGVLGDRPEPVIPAPRGQTYQAAEPECREARVAVDIDGPEGAIGADPRQAERSYGIPSQKEVSRETSAVSVPEEAARAKEARRALSEIQAKVDEVLKKALPATVRFHPDRGTFFSGVIVTEDGYIATCAHHFLLPRAKIAVFLADGRKVTGEVLGSHRYWDISLVKIKDEGKWPRVSLGKSASMRREDLCIALGYPADGNRPDWEKVSEVKARIGRVIYLAAPGLLQTSCLIQGGDSGGPLLDLDGRLTGIHHGVGSLHFAGSLHAGAELYQDLWDELVAGKRVELAPRGLGERSEIFRRAIADGSSITVDVLCDGRPTLLGTIVDPEGWILTKASDLDGRISCRLSDGREFEATRCGVSQQHDLAMLKVQPRGLPKIKWSQRGEPSVGTLVSAPGCRTKWSLSIVGGRVHPISAKVAAENASLSAGVISHRRRAVPPMIGLPKIDVKERDGGLVVTAVHQGSAEAAIGLQVGDFVSRIKGQPMPTLRAYDEVLARNEVAGDPITMSVRRGGREIVVRVILDPSVGKSSTFPLSHRRTGFPDVLSTDLDLRPETCGGPLIDLMGEVVGVNIARESEIESYAIPAETVRKLIDELRATSTDVSR